MGLFHAHRERAAARPEVEAGGNPAVRVLLPASDEGVSRQGVPRPVEAVPCRVQGRPSRPLAQRPGSVRPAARRDPVRRQIRGAEVLARRLGLDGMPGRQGDDARTPGRPSASRRPTPPAPGTSPGPGRGRRGNSRVGALPAAASTRCRRAPGPGRRGRCTGSADRCCGGRGSDWPAPVRRGRAGSGRGRWRHCGRGRCRPRPAADTASRRCGGGAALPGAACPRRTTRVPGLPAPFRRRGRYGRALLRRVRPSRCRRRPGRGRDRCRTGRSTPGRTRGPVAVHC